MRASTADDPGGLKVLVVDDESLARGRLVRMLTRIPGVEVVGEAENGTVALAQIAHTHPDLVLLDIEMPGMDGLSLAEAPGMPPIIFTTAHVNFATDAFDLDAVDYLIKPVRQDRLERALEKVRRRVAPQVMPQSHPIAVHTARGARFVDARKVTVFRALDKYTEFTLDGEQLLIRDSLEALEARLGVLGFIRVHRAAIVRRDAIVKLESARDGLVVRLVDGSSVDVSRRQAAALRRLLGLRR